MFFTTIAKGEIFISLVNNGCNLICRFGFFLG